MLPWLLIATLALIVLAIGVSRLRAVAQRRARAAESKRKEPRVPRLQPKDRNLLLLMIDGLPAHVFDDALASGSLPNLARLFAERPTLAMTALSTFPSATAPSLPEMLAGRYAGLDDLPAPGAVHAFDREQRRIVRYVTEPDAWNWPLPNLFDAAREAGLSVVTVFEGRWDGPHSILTMAATSRAAALEVIGAGELGTGDRGPVQEYLQRVRKRGVPRTSLVVFNEVDLKGHFHGPRSLHATQALVQTDVLIGEIFEALREQKHEDGTSALDRTSVILFGDHGMAESGRFLDLESVFRKQGLSVYDASTVTHVVLRERLGQLWTRWPDAILVSGGSNITQVYLRDADGAWSPASPAADREKLEHPRPDVDALVRTLVEQPGIGQVLRAIPDDGVEIFARENRAARVIGRRDAGGVRWAYVIADDAVTDPFDYVQDAAIAQMVARVGRLDDASFHTADAWMERTMHHRYPGAVALVSKAFHPQRFTGDLMLTALPGWSFLRSFGGDHGNLERESMLAPLVINGPGIEQARAPRLVRLVDLYPTAAVLLGASPDDPALRELDGRPIPGARGP
jgi:hypothetical protein